MLPLRRMATLPAGIPGRAGISGRVAAVFGATGFLGRYVVNRLGREGSQVVIPFRGDEHDWRHLRVTGDLGMIHFVPFQLLDKDQVLRAMESADVVINLIGQDTDSRHFALEDVHETGAKIVAEAASTLGIQRLVHVSALGANPDSPSRFLASKGRGELLVREAFKDADIVRPANMMGHEDRFLNRMAFLAQTRLGQLLFDGGQAKKRPVYVLDVADGIHHIISSPVRGGLWEFYGKEMTMKEIATYVNRTVRKPDHSTYVPSALVRPIARLLDRLPLDPVMSEEHIVRFITSDVVDPHALDLSVVGITPTEMEKVALAWLRRFRPPAMHDDIMELRQ